jgi:alpha-ketoglutarate-dependent taurine dioxygenase
MLTPTLTDARAWRASTIDTADCWYHHLSEAALSALEQNIREQQRGNQPVLGWAASPALHAACTDDRQRLSTALEEGRGFVVITPGQANRYTPSELQAVYWLLGQVLGKPVEQNVQGTLLYDVRDTGQDVRYGARFSVTNAESTFHTDNSFGAEPTDYIGLLCLNASKSGGESQIVSGCTVEQELHTHHREVWEILRQPFHVDRRGGLLPGEEPTVHVPVFTGHSSDLLIRYLRYWIEVGHEKVGIALTAEQVRALDVFDQVANERPLRVEFTLRPGEMLFVNNRWILHNRTAFEDWTEPERRRHYVRLWLRRSRLLAA